MAKLYFRYGTMGSGKTIDLLKVAYNYEERGKEVIIFSPDKDNRFGVGKVKTRIGIERESINITEDIDLFEFVKDIKNKPAIILVDEAQFFTEKQIYELSDIVDIFNIPVICYGLRTDFRLDFFSGSKALMQIADSIEEIKTICECGKKATVNMRVVDGKPVKEGKQIKIGGNESYKSVCRNCYKKYMNGEK